MGTKTSSLLNRDGTSLSKIVNTYQEVNPTVLSTADNSAGTNGSLTLHEVTESYQAGLTTKNTGLDASPPSGRPDLNGPLPDLKKNSQYWNAHTSATPQNLQINENVYDANGNRINTYQGAARVDYTLTNGTVIMTYP
ncbi:hypothetical protein DRF60_05370 [Chryseobacterium elymi]|uniref:Uncharacterized protein n=1 Tax=Chryseobacterium elymi TaxID=395936 RepID=A0A3D9DPC5_9FLAO|nr:hypothetical protein [Chryseobacterium elymi]REC79829.1 hypothetical protein DRF60_05370 [Chryseobacterium elymi]